MAGGPARHACRRWTGSTRNFNFLVWGILSHAQERLHEEFRFLRRCCGWTESRRGSMCWPVDRPDTHAAGGPAARGILIFLVWGIISHAQKQLHEEFRFLRRCCGWTEICRGSMCWPADRPDTHAAGGPAARGILIFLVWGILSHARERPHTAYRRWTGNTRGFDFFGLGDSFTRSGVTAQGGIFWFWKFSPAPL